MASQKDKAIIKFAKKYIQRGWSPIPIPYMSKCPKIKEWQNLRITLEEVHRFFNTKPMNVGVLCGEPSGGLIDVDLDSKEAVSLADEFLPKTHCIFGRPSKPRSHRIYLIISNPNYQKFNDPQGGAILEIRSTKCQTVFPPSIHPSGEEIMFYEEGNPLVIEEDLFSSVKKLAAAALLAKYWPASGTRQEAALALCGGLLGMGWTEAATTRFIQSVTVEAGDEEVRMRLTCANSTQKRLNAARTTTGWKHLSTLMDRKVVEKVRNWLGDLPQDNVTDSNNIKSSVRRIRQKTKSLEEKHRAISTLIISELHRLGTFYQTSHGFFFFDSSDCKLLSLEDPELRARINDRFDVNGSESTWRFLKEELHKEATLRGVETTVYRFARYERKKLYIYKGENKVLVLDGKEMFEVSTGTDGVLFLHDPMMEPINPAKSENSDQLNEVLTVTNFKGSGNLNPHQEELLFKIWVLSLFFESLLPTKPLLLLYGEKGSGKTTGLRILLRSLFGKRAQVLTLNRQKEDAFLAAITSNHLVVLDNVDGYIHWLPNHLATVATGGEVGLRTLYTTNTLSRYTIQSFLAITSRDPYCFTRDDIADRLLILRAERFPRFSPEKELIQQFSENRPKFWEELLHLLNKIVKALKEPSMPPTEHRLADFASFAWAIREVLKVSDQDIQEILQGMNAEKVEFSLENNDLFQALLYWIQNGGMGDRIYIDTGSLYGELNGVWPTREFPIKSSRSLSRQLKNMKQELEKHIKIDGPKKLPGGNNMTFWRITPEGNNKEVQGDLYEEEI